MQPVGAPRGDSYIPVDTDKIVGGSKLLGEMRDHIRRKHYSIGSEQAYLDWAKRYILFHGKRHPTEMAEAQIVAFLNHLAVERSVAASTQNQALNALVFLYKQVLGREDLALANITPAKRPERLPTVLDRGEIERLFLQLEGTPKLVAALLYGAGLRLLEGLRLRIQDIEFERNQVVVRNGKGAKDRVTLLPPGLVQPIRDQMAVASQVHGKDLAIGLGEVYLPPLRPRTQIPEGGEAMGLAIPVSRRFHRHRPALGKDPAPPYRRVGHPTCREEGDIGGRYPQAWQLPYLEAQLRNPSSGGRLRHPHPTGAARAQ